MMLRFTITDDEGRCIRREIDVWRALAEPRLIFTTITRYDSRSRVQPPSQVTSQSPKRGPIVTG
jgi:hypothetical protein